MRILGEVAVIAAEDTRRTGKLLHHLQIATPQISCHEHNEHQPLIIGRLQAGESIALVTDAGMPGISDPGYLVVAACVAAGIEIIPIPGPTAFVTGLSASGLPTDRFVFEGFLPAQGSDRQLRLQALVSELRTILLYESPHRLRRTLADLAQSLGPDRPIALGRELTKLYEEFWRGSLAGAITYYQTKEPQGEYTITIGGAPPSTIQHSDASLKAELTQMLAQGISRSEASKQLAAITAISKRHIYQLALELES
jgi:16S rRNA (cytidine1402-2'-O)-methyltransferase